MKTTARPIIRLFGFRLVLIGNALFVAAISGSYALFTSATPRWILLTTLLAGGFFRSLQMTALAALTFADVPQAQMSRASSLSAMFQQLAQSLGIGLAAILIHATLRLHHSARIAAGDISPSFVIIAAASLIALAFFVRLPREAGAEVSGRPA